MYCIIKRTLYITISPKQIYFHQTIAFKHSLAHAKKQWNFKCISFHPHLFHRTFM